MSYVLNLCVVTNVNSVRPYILAITLLLESRVYTFVEPRRCHNSHVIRSVRIIILLKGLPEASKGFLKAFERPLYGLLKALKGL